MAFQELIKNFEKVRYYLRDFSVYGYKVRSDFTEKSSRSYDNERRRIENFLSGYIKQEQSTKGKKVSIAADSQLLSNNPFFSAWGGKSFTKNDILLHFVLMDLLGDESFGKVAITTIVTMVEKALEKVPAYELPDPMTIRLKLNEYVALGILAMEKEGKTSYYSFPKSLYEKVSTAIWQELMIGLAYYENVSPIGFLGASLGRFTPYGKNIMTFRHHHIVQVLEDEVLLQLLTAISQRQLVSFDSQGKNKCVIEHKHIVPLRIYHHVTTGRRYVGGYNPKNHQYVSFRLDTLSNVKMLKPFEEVNNHQSHLDELFKHVWGVSLPNQRKLQYLTMTLAIDEITEGYVLQRLRREARQGKVEKTGSNLYRFTIELYELMEIIPWIRTFIGRIITFDSSNKDIEALFHNDLALMLSYYTDLDEAEEGEESNGTV